MKKLLFVLLTFLANQAFATSYHSSLTLINGIMTKGTLSIQASHESCVSNFYGHYNFGELVTEKSWVTLNATTADLSGCSANTATWNFDLYYTMPGKSVPTYIASISPTVTNTGTQWKIINPNSSWLSIQQYNNEPLFILNGVPSL